MARRSRGRNPGINYEYFRPRFPWFGADAQTLRNYIAKPGVDLARWPAETLMFETDDGSGDQLGGRLQRGSANGEAAKEPLIVIVHGLTGCEESYNLRLSASYFLRQGFDVMRLNLRGATPFRSTARDTYHAGRSGDWRVVAEKLHGLYDRPLFFIGYSLGGATLTKALSEFGDQYGIIGGASICAPFDLDRTQKRMDDLRNLPYHKYVLGHMKIAWGNAPEILEQELEAIKKSRRVREFDERYLAPKYGYPNAKAFYEENAAKNFLPNLKAPLLVIHNLKDPWIPASIYEQIDWSQAPLATCVMANTGGHCGFHEKGERELWQDRRVHRFMRELG